MIGLPPTSGTDCYARWPVALDPIYGCWLWQGRRDADGYGRLDGQLAHYAVWRALRGEIPPGKQLDHVCRRRACVAPTHLEPVSKADNERRKSWRYRSRRTHCSAGHDLGIHGRLTPEGGKVCRSCSGV